MALPPRPAPGQRSGLLGHSNGYHPSRRKGPPIATLRAAAAGPHPSQWTQTTDGHGQQLSTKGASRHLSGSGFCVSVHDPGLVGSGNEVFQLVGAWCPAIALRIAVVGMPRESAT